MRPFSCGKNINRKIFAHIASRTKKGLIVSPITLKPYLDSDEDFKDIDVPSLLTELSAMAISAYAAKDYANALFDLSKTSFDFKCIMPSPYC